MLVIVLFKSLLMHNSNYNIASFVVTSVKQEDNNMKYCFIFQGLYLLSARRLAYIGPAIKGGCVTR
jgi:hypothetical protein